MSTEKCPIYIPGEEWTREKIYRAIEEAKIIADEELKLDYFPIQVEIVTTEQMIDAFASSGIPVNYHHWSFGKRFIESESYYRHGGGLAYELVINSDPCIAYYMEDNSMTHQALVTAHAVFGHNSFFKSNAVFQEWTHPSSIIDYFIFARRYIAGCEERYGVSAVEQVLDACHSVRHYAYDRYKPPPVFSMVEEEKRQRERADYLERQINILWHTIPKKQTVEKIVDERFPQEPQENILYFIEKNAPELPVWKREIIRITRKIAQYFYPQNVTQIMNEGWASFVHHYIMNRFYDKGLITNGAMQEFLASHTSVLHQRRLDEDNGLFYINPYALGFAVYTDIKRICEHPTEEDRVWFSNLAGSDWLQALHFAIKNFKDESFILQYLSPKVIRDFRLFSILDDDSKNVYEIMGYQHIRNTLASQYDLSLLVPHIEVYNVDRRGDRTLTLRYCPINRKLLHENDAKKTLLYVEKLWEFPVELVTDTPQEGEIKRLWRVENGKFV
jgi:stage V sporulation protein R